MNRGLFFHTAIISLVLLGIVTLGLLPEFSGSDSVKLLQTRAAANYAPAYLPVTSSHGLSQQRSNYGSAVAMPQMVGGIGQGQTVAPVTYMSSKAAQVHVIGTQPTSQNTQDYTTTKSVSSVVGTNTWKGQITMVAAPALAYVPAQSGELPAEMFAPAIRRAPPDEEGGGTNGPNLEQPLGDAIPFCILLAIIFILIKRYTYKHEN